MVELIKTMEKVCHLDVLGERHDPVFIKCSNKFRINFVLRIVHPSSLIHLLPICPSFVGHPSPHIVFHILIRQLCHYCICILQPWFKLFYTSLSSASYLTVSKWAYVSNSRKAPTWNHQMMLRKAPINSQAHVGNYMYQNQKDEQD